MAVYHKREMKVHIWGGHSDSSSGRPWKKDTTTLLFSVAKVIPSTINTLPWIDAISAVCVALLVDRGLLNYQDLVVKHWPEYGQNGKNGTTVEDILTHKAGLPYLDEAIQMTDVGTEKIRKINERSKPAWTPGSIDGRDVSTFFREEIAQVYDLDISIGLPRTEVHRSARLTLPDTFEYLMDFIQDPRLIAALCGMLVRFDGLLHKIAATNTWINYDSEVFTLNDPDVSSLPHSAVAGVGTADSIARLFSLLQQGKFISNTTLTTLQRPSLDTWHIEQVFFFPVLKGHGFFYDPHPTIKGAYTFGHPGFGGQMLYIDPINELVFVYITNGLKTGTGDLCNPGKRLLTSLKIAIDQSQ